MSVVEKNKVVGIEYTMLLEEGQVIDSTKGNPFVFLFGAGEVFPKLEEGIEGMSEGEERDIVLEPEDAFGEYDPEAIQIIPQQYFGDEVPVVGMQYFAHFEEGNEIPFSVKELKDGNVTIDFNHPFAGKKIKFHLKVTSIRDASPEELEHGHAHHD
ncbi:MAG TPA: peptidylprolyl isomerase [Candidatus Hydrothermia bacterium]|nr:peptidylprolyl isomerase [Candidatus Hydrothermia bacterium]